MINQKTVQYPFDKTDLVNEVDYAAGSNKIYEGYAAPGTATSAAAWQIVKHTYDGSDNRLTTKFAGGTNDYNQVWDNRASLSYS